MAEGHLVIRRLVRSGHTIRSLLLTPRRYADLADDLAGVTAPVYMAEAPVLSAIAGFDVHRGALAAAVRPAPRSATELVNDASLVVVLEGLTDHENVGAIFRTAAALGADAVLLSPSCADPLYRRSIRVSMGAVLDLAFAPLAPWPEALATLAEHGFEVVALTPDAAAGRLENLVPPHRVALVLGAEGPGLTPAALGAAHQRVRIPMAHGADSLNVAATAAIVLHHLSGPSFEAARSPEP